MLLQLLLILVVILSASKINVGLIVPEKVCESMRVLHPEEMEGWDIVLKTSWYFLPMDRTFFFLLFKSVLRLQ